MHNLYSTPTLQDITTVENDLKRPLANFEDFLDHVTDHINNYESLRSFNQQVANITKIQTFKESIKRWPQFDALIATWEMDNNNVLTRAFANFTHRLPAATAIRIRNYTTTATTTDGIFPTPDQNAESCRMTHPTHEPKRKLHLPRTPPLMVTRLSNQYSPTVANDPSSSPGCSTAIDYNQQGPTSPRHPRPTSLLHYLRGCQTL